MTRNAKRIITTAVEDLAAKVAEFNAAFPDDMEVAQMVDECLILKTRLRNVPEVGF